MADDPLQPLILCMESASGQDIVLKIEPTDDFQSFLSKARTILGFDVDLNAITRNKKVNLTDNIYQFLLSSDHNLDTDIELSAETLERLLEPNNEANDLVYVLDDGTQINASQIQFDNEDPLLDLTKEKIPFIKYIDDGKLDEAHEQIEVEDTRRYDIVGSPIHKWSDKNTSPRTNFVNSLPFRLVCRDTSSFEAQFTKYLEGNNSKTYTTLNPVTAINKSPRSLIRENYKHYTTTQDNFDNKPEEKPKFSREDVLNMFKDSPLATVPYESNNISEKRRRKTDPSKPIYKKNDNRSIINMDNMLIGDIESQHCFVCNKFVDEKLYLFDKEDQRLHRSSPLSHQKKINTQLKIICELCLHENFKPCKTKSPNQSLNSNEYLVISNNQQYIFQKTNSLNLTPIPPGNFVDLGEAKAIIDKIESEILKSGSDKERDFVKLEIGSDGEIIKTNQNDPTSDVDIVKEKRRDSDEELVEPVIEIDDSVIDNLEEADEQVKEFLGKYQDNEGDKELKCRFCEKLFADLSEVTEHGSEHKHKMDDGEVYPCPLCDYGYANFKWLNGHLKAAHQKSNKTKEDTCEIDITVEGVETNEESSPKATSPIARRTRSAIKKGDPTKEKEIIENPAPELKEMDTKEETNPNIGQNITESESHIITTEVKQECIDSDEEAIWIVQTGEDDSDLNQDQVNELLAKAKAQDDQQSKSKKVTFQCKTCCQVFSSSEALQKHKCAKKRTRKRKTEKEVGGQPLLSDDENVQQIPRKKKKGQPTSDPQIVTCHNCNESFTSKVRLKFHMQFHEPNSIVTEDGRYACLQCDGSTFETESALYDHVHFAHDKRRWRCDVPRCQKTFHLRACLTKHRRTHTDTRRYVCTTCGKRFLDKQTLDEHSVTHLQTKPFECPHCRKQLTRRSRLRMHLRAHEERLRAAHVLVCRACCRAFKDAEEAEEHVRGNDAASKECLESIVVKRELLSPSSGLVSKPFDTAGEAATSDMIIYEAFTKTATEMLLDLSEDSRALIKVVQIEKAFRCEFCELVYYLEDGLNTHRMVHKGVKNPFQCHICKVSFASYSRCTTHKTTHGFFKRSLADAKKAADGDSPAIPEAEDKTGSGPSATGIVGYGGFPVVKHFLCEDCGRSYLHWTYLQVHRRMKHANDNFIYKCNQCEMVFPNSWSAAYHRKKIHGKAGQEDGKIEKISREDHGIPCRDCDEVLPNKNALYKHRMEEHSDRCIDSPPKAGVFCCGACDKSYSTRAELSAHAGTHAASCNKCALTFTEPASLRAHMAEIHGQELSSGMPRGGHSGHACGVCGHTFRTVSMRNEHLRIHTGERPFPCDLCPLAFRRSTAMRNHRLIHTGERAWGCERCPKRFRIRSDLRTHARQKHPERIVVIEVPGLNPSAEEILHHLNKNNIPTDKILDISKISFLKGTSSMVPSSERALRMLSTLQKAVPEWGSAAAEPSAVHNSWDDVIKAERLDMFQASHLGRGIAPLPRRPAILQRAANEDQLNASGAYPLAVNVTQVQDLSELNVQKLLQEGVLVNGNQMVQLQLDDDKVLGE